MHKGHMKGDMSKYMDAMMKKQCGHGPKKMESPNRETKRKPKRKK